MNDTTNQREQERRWRLAIGVEDDESYQSEARDARIAAALKVLYGEEHTDTKARKGSLSRSAPRVAK